MNLHPGAEYEFALALGDGPEATVKARTWSNMFPIASSVSLPKGTTRQPLRIVQGGTANGYRLYTAAPELFGVD